VLDDLPAAGSAQDAHSAAQGTRNGAEDLRRSILPRHAQRAGSAAAPSRSAARRAALEDLPAAGSVQDAHSAAQGAGNSAEDLPRSIFPRHAQRAAPVLFLCRRRAQPARKSLPRLEKYVKIRENMLTYVIIRSIIIDRKRDDAIEIQRAI